MMSTPLQRFPLCQSADVDEFTARLNAVYYPASVVSGPRRHGIQASTLNAVHSADFTIGYIRPGSPVRVTPHLDATTFHINLAWSGTAQAMCGDDTVLLAPTHASVHNVREPHVLVAGEAGNDILGLKFGRGLVEDELGMMLGHPIGEPLQFSHSFDLGQGAGASFLMFVRLILNELSTAGLLDATPVRRQYVRTLIAALLGAQPHNYSDALLVAGAPMRPRTLRRALAYIESNYELPITVTDVATAAGSSVRRLQEAFQDHLGDSPMGYLRNYRLDVAHRALGDGDCSVTEVAHRCGFTHLGRFSASYRERFGELPSHTLTGTDGRDLVSSSS